MAYDPASTRNLSRDVARELLVQPLIALNSVTKFERGGVYAIYYNGSSPLYAALSHPKGAKGPIYIGKGQLTKSSGPSPLYGRLLMHRRSLDAVPTLDSNDFLCRYLVLYEVWIRPSEDFLVDHFRPLWNDVVRGFGNNAVGSARGGGRISPWDSLHAGRIGAAKGATTWTTGAPTAIAAHLAAHPPKGKVP